MMAWLNGQKFCCHLPYAQTGVGSTAYENTKTFFNRSRTMLDEEAHDFRFR